MKDGTFEVIEKILNYAIKNNVFSKKDFKNVVYTNEFNNYEIDDNISEGFEYLLKYGFLQIKNKKATYYENYELSKRIKINTKNNSKIFKNLTKNEILSNNFDIISCIEIIDSDFIEEKDKVFIKNTLTKALISLARGSRTYYSLLTIMQLLALKTSIKIEIKSKEYTFFASNIKINYIQFNDESLLIGFDKGTFEILDLKDIVKIESVKEVFLKEDITLVLKVLKNSIANKGVQFLINFFDSLYLNIDSSQCKISD